MVAAAQAVCHTDRPALVSTARPSYDGAMATEFVSESIRPRAGSFDASAMGRGEPGLPSAFQWRDAWYDVIECRTYWKETSSEGARAGGDVYLRRHCYELDMSDGSVWTVYCVRQPPRSGSPKALWYLYTIERGRE